MGMGRGRGRVTGHEAAVLPEDEVDRHLLEVLAFLVVPRVKPIKRARDDGSVDERGVEVERRHGPALLVAEGEAEVTLAQGGSS
eukprot:scaffold21070_cov40-Phaeocystis_antarctica.AAC.1